MIILHKAVPNGRCRMCTDSKTPNKACVLAEVNNLTAVFCMSHLYAMAELDTESSKGTAEVPNGVSETAHPSLS